jgi:DNA (cytosine-5)-methyltransferase 1
MKVISTFAGCGGSSTGYKMAGCTVLACVEWDDHAVLCYRLNHPTTKVFHGDIAKVTGVALMEATGLKAGELDVLDGSPPCQGFSTSGKRILDDPRNSLFREHIRLVDELQPKNVVIENVAGMIKGQMKPVAGEVVRCLKDRGYQVVAGLMEAQYFGVPQVRPRVFFIGSKLGRPTLPKAKTKPITAGEALMNVEPDEYPTFTNPCGRLFATMAKPGHSGDSIMKSIGRKSGWYGTFMLDPDKPSPTITKTCIGGRGNAWHWTRRHISIREALVLTGFPPDYQLPGKFEDRWARIGNSVAPPMTKAIAEMLMELQNARP